jgi:signal transduction histidine kinase
MSTRILIVEDDTAVREVLSEVLGLNGFEVVTATQGAEALGAIADRQPDLVLSDVAMPVMDGFALVRALRERPETRTLPVILLTALSEREQVRRGMDLGADDYLTKPFTSDELLRSIGARLDKKALIDELDAFAHTVAHGLKNALTPVLHGAERLAGRTGSLAECERDEVSRQVLAHARRIRSVIDELMFLTTLRKASLVCEPLNMETVTATVLARLEGMIHEFQATVDNTTHWPLAYGHAGWVEEIWVNYITNAIKFGGRPPQVAIGGELLPGQMARFWVRDNGRGLSPEEQRRLFVPFTRLGRTEDQGHGLGLSIVRRIVDRLGGRAGVESVPGSGSLFYFTLPAVDRQRQPRPPGDVRSQRP